MLNVAQLIFISILSYEVKKQTLHDNQDYLSFVKIPLSASSQQSFVSFSI